ncbi:MAG: type VI secretion system tip protein VgrG [Chitinivibrionales bacterium]|nr:type VI secretion system tip protein VgrG [Chitinivibrionales bacterium]
MQAKKANEAEFYFLCSGQDATTFQVMNFSGTDRISSPYQFDITLISKKADIDADKVINKRATLYVFRDGEFYPYSGIVSEFLFVDRTVDYCTYNVRLVPRLWLLSLNRQTRVFQKKNAAQIIKQVLDEAGLNNYYEMKAAVNSYPEREYVVQYQEPDLNFISRLMEDNGMWYFFTEAPVIPEEIGGKSGTETMVIADKPAEFKFIGGEQTIKYRSGSGMVEKFDSEVKEFFHRLHYDKHVIPNEVMVKSYNYRTPEVDVNGRKKIREGQQGTVYEYGRSIKDSTEAQRLADIATDRIACSQVQVRGSGNCRGFRAGNRFAAEDHVRDDLNGKYLLVSVNHAGSHAYTKDSGHVFTYSNEFVSIPAKQAEHFRPAKRAVVPRVNGVMTAKIEAEGSEYAALDDVGRYKVRMPFDLSGKKNYDASKYVRLSQPYAGSNYGIHFPSHEGAEMVFGCVDGDPDRPLGLGTVPNANTISPVKSSNKEQSVIRTAGGNEIILDDMKDKQKISIKTTAANVFTMDDEKRNCSLKTTDGNSITLDDENEKCALDSQGHVLNVSYKGGEEGIGIKTAGGHVIMLDDANNNISIKTNGGHTITFDDGGGSITMEDSNGNSISTDSGGIILNSAGEIKISASTNVTIEAGGNMKITSSGNFDEEAGANYKVSAGGNYEASGGMNAKVSGSMNGEYTGGMNVKVEGGVMADLKGGAKTSVSGGVVMIN